MLGMELDIEDLDELLELVAENEKFTVTETLKLLNISV